MKRVLTKEKVDGNTHCLLTFSSEVMQQLHTHQEAYSNVRMLRNFVARGKSCLDSIYSLWTLNRMVDAMILERHLFDLALTIASVSKNNKYDGFRYYTMYERCRMASAMLNDKMLSSKMNSEHRKEQNEHKIAWQQAKESFRRAGKTIPMWRRPREQKAIEDLLTFPEIGQYIQSYKALSLNFVHPVSDTGEIDRLAFGGVDLIEGTEKLEVMENGNIVMLILMHHILDAAHKLTDCEGYLKLGLRLLQTNKF